MKFFQETQRFSQWWLYLIVFSVQIMILTEIFRGTSGFQESQTPWKIILALFIIMLLSLIFFFKLKTTIDSTGISARFGVGNIFFRQYKWQEISECYVREYLPLTEYGGWGIRGIGKPKAYTTSGKYGIQIISRSGERFLIGTQKPDEIKKILKNYKQKFNS